MAAAAPWNLLARPYPQGEGLGKPGESNPLRLSFQENTAPGETLAERILAYRAENGSFVSTEQLMDIDGIGEGTYNSIRDLVTVEDNP